MSSPSASSACLRACALSRRARSWARPGRGDVVGVRTDRPLRQLAAGRLVRFFDEGAAHDTRGECRRRGEFKPCRGPVSAWAAAACRCTWANRSGRPTASSSSPCAARPARCRSCRSAPRPAAMSRSASIRTLSWRGSPSSSSSITASQLGSQLWLIQRAVLPSDVGVDDVVVVEREQEGVTGVGAVAVYAVGLGCA